MGELTPSFHHVGTRNQTQVFRLIGKCLHLPGIPQTTGREGLWSVKVLPSFVHVPATWVCQGLQRPHPLCLPYPGEATLLPGNAEPLKQWGGTEAARSRPRFSCFLLL